MSGQSTGSCEVRSVGWPNAKQNSKGDMSGHLTRMRGVVTACPAGMSGIWGWEQGGVGEGREMGMSPLNSIKIFSVAPLTLQVEAWPCCHILALVKYF